ncbi:hypothetical protein ZIOFF_002268 [Zingiber officinale]|uniref:EF-hand domain-containing protein n=1 Tax=Zingiber officinale TaxID=94328 RepID=A0A8J5M9C3_ZINOF|nr:hypothetical protein ZIOFF_002268 [Zingiber officinale]
MASRPDQVPDMRVFDAYFLRADVDRDGRISGKEAVTFFEGSNLPRPVLAQKPLWLEEMEQMPVRSPDLPLKTIRRIMKPKQMENRITPDVPLLLARACEVLIMDITQRAWDMTDEHIRTALSREAVAAIIDSINL